MRSCDRRLSRRNLPRATRHRHRRMANLRGGAASWGLTRAAMHSRTSDTLSSSACKSCLERNATRTSDGCADGSCGDRAQDDTARTALLQPHSTATLTRCVCALGFLHRPDPASAMSSASTPAFAASLTTSTGFNPQAYLEKFGYASGKGLGKKEDGRTSHILVNKKDDTKGVSADATARGGGRSAPTRCRVSAAASRARSLSHSPSLCLLFSCTQVGAHEDYTKSFEKLFNQAAASGTKVGGALSGGITFFDSDDDEQTESKEPPRAADAASDEERERKVKKEEKKRKKEKKKAAAEAAADSDAEAPTDAAGDQPSAKKSKTHHSPASSPAPSASPSPSAAAAPASSVKTLPSSSVHYIQFNMGSKLLADSHAEVDMSGRKLREASMGSEGKSKKAKKSKKETKEKTKQSERDELDELEARGGMGLGMGMGMGGGLGLGAAASDSESGSDSDDSDAGASGLGGDMKYISSSKPRPAASHIPRARENQTLKLGSQVAEVNGNHLYHDRSQGKMRRLEEADRAYREAMAAKKQREEEEVAARVAKKAATVAAAKAEKEKGMGAFTSPLFAAPSPSPPPPSAHSPSPSPSASPISQKDEEETAEQRAERKAAKKLRKEAKRAKKDS